MMRSLITYADDTEIIVSGEPRTDSHPPVGALEVCTQASEGARVEISPREMRQLAAALMRAADIMDGVDD
jgi:hypothetical protein